MTRATLLMAVLALLVMPAASADPVKGAWAFRTDIEDKGCVITGRMNVTPTGADGLFDCAFVSSETCDYMPDREVSMEQLCRIVKQDDRYVIRSVVSGTRSEGYDPRNYNPDHFVVEPDGPGRMAGVWWDVNFEAPVAFWRDDDLPIS